MLLVKHKQGKQGSYFLKIRIEVITRKIAQYNWENSDRISNDSPTPESYNTSAADSRGSARFEDKLKRSPSSAPSLNEDLAAYDCNDKELP